LPYYTSYYQKNWGFSLEYNKFKNLNKKKFYKVLVDSKHFKGEMNYTELLIKGKSKKEIMIMSYICHPSMANNELSGPLIIMALSKILKPQKYSVRLLLVPETIGAINFIKKNFKNLKKNLIAGFNLTCIGDKGPFTLISSKEENTYADKVAFRVLGKTKNFKKLSFLNRGSNERQFGCQNLNLPFVTICRTKFGDFKEYHTSDDNLKIINEKNLKKSLNMILKIIQEIQNNKIFIKKIYCEPFFTKYKLVRTIRGKQNLFERDISNITAYADKNSDLKDLAIKLNINSNKLNEKIKILQKHSILKEYI
jgi:aminopeptidase-like protein